MSSSNQITIVSITKDIETGCKVVCFSIDGSENQNKLFTIEYHAAGPFCGSCWNYNCWHIVEYPQFINQQHK